MVEIEVKIKFNKQNIGKITSLALMSTCLVMCQLNWQQNYSLPRVHCVNASLKPSPWIWMWYNCSASLKITIQEGKYVQTPTPSPKSVVSRVKWWIYIQSICCALVWFNLKTVYMFLILQSPEKTWLISALSVSTWLKRTPMNIVTLTLLCLN